MIRQLYRIIILLFLILLFPKAIPAWSLGDVVINEVMWMGSSYSVNDEFIELRNLTISSVNFASTPWSIYKNNVFMLAINQGTLLPNGYFLISRSDTAYSVLGIVPDIISTALVLNNSDCQYKLYAGPNNTSVLLDIADDGTGAPSAGKYAGVAGNVFWSMERNSPPGNGTVSANWHDACLKRNLDVGVIDRGTPRADNYKNISPTWSGVAAPNLAIDDSNIVFYAGNCRDSDVLPDSMEIIGTWWKVGSPMPVYTYTIYGIANGETVAVVFPSEHTQPGTQYVWKINLDDGTDTLYAAGTLFVHFNQRDLVIDEICWGGSSRSTSDEWLELFNAKDDTIKFGITPFYLWRITAFGEVLRLATLSSGNIAPGQRWLIKRLPAGNPQTAVAAPPTMVMSNLSFPDGRVFSALTDLPDTQYFIDAAGNMGTPPAGLINFDDSLWATMTRIHPIADGRISASWRTSTVSKGYLPGILDRGTPSFADIINSAPVLSSPDSIPIFEPDTGTRDTEFVFRILYSDRDSNPPDSAILLLDTNYDNSWSGDELFPLTIESGIEFVSGVVLRTSVSNLRPTLAGGKFTFRVSDSLVWTPFPIPERSGPIVFPTAAMELSPTVWNIDTLEARTDSFVVSPPIFLRNTGDLPAKISLKIVRQDTFEYECCMDFCEGGWRATCNPIELICNSYILSAIFVPDGLTPNRNYFNEFVMEDCLRFNRYTLARNDTLGFDGFSEADGLLPNAEAFLWFMLRPPFFSGGRHSAEEHIITVQLRCMVTIP